MTGIRLMDQSGDISAVMKGKAEEVRDRDKVIKYIAVALFAAQLLYIVFINLFKCHAWLDHDASMLYRHTMYMWEQKKFVLPFYQEETFLHIDTSCLLAMPLYGLTHDIFLSYGISNVIFLLLTLFVMYDLLTKLNVKDQYRYLAMLVYLIPFRVGLVQYMNMLFYECSFYNICILVTILAIDLFLYPDVRKGEHDRKYVVFMVLYVFFTALTAFSRGTYVLLISLLPIILCYGLEVMLSEEGLGHIRRSKIGVIAATMISYAAGMLLGKITGFMPRVTGYSLVLPHDIFNNFTLVFWGHLSIFADRENPDVMSIAGIRMLIMLGFAFSVIALFIFNMKHVFREEENTNALRYLTIIYVWNIFILGLTDCSGGDWAYQERYLFTGFVPLILSLPVALKYIEGIKRKLLSGTLFMGVCALILFTAAVCDHGVIRKFRENAEDLKGIREVLDHAKSSGVDTVFFLNDDNAGLLSLSLEPSLKVVSVQTHEDGTYELRSRENYKCAHDRAYYGDENIMAVKWDQQPEDVLSEYQLSSYQYVGDVEDYHLYHAGSNKFDDRTGFPLNDNVMNKSIDFCYSEGYRYIGDIDLYGYLETTGADNYVLLSPLLDPPYTTCSVTLSYEDGLKTTEGYEDNGSDGDVIGSLMLLDENADPVDKADIVKGKGQAVLRVSGMRPCYIAVWLNSGGSVTIHEIDYEFASDEQPDEQM